jgi:hypothetical protein
MKKKAKAKAKVKVKAKIGKRSKTKDLSAKKATSVRGGTESVTRPLSAGALKIAPSTLISPISQTFNK